MSTPSDLSGSGLMGLRTLAADASEAEQKSTREQAQRWAQAVGVEIARVSQIATLPQPSSGAGDPTSCWRPGAGDLTRQPSTGGSAGGASETSSNAADSSERLTLNVDGGDLGALSLVVDRKAGAISVTIGVRDSAAEAALGLERNALQQALTAQGITLNSLRIVRSDGLGTVLAPSRGDAKQRTRADGDTVPNDTEKRRLARKLNLVG